MPAVLQLRTGLADGASCSRRMGLRISQALHTTVRRAGHACPRRSRCYLYHTMMDMTSPVSLCSINTLAPMTLTPVIRTEPPYEPHPEPHPPPTPTGLHLSQQKPPLVRRATTRHCKTDQYCLRQQPIGRPLSVI